MVTANGFFEGPEHDISWHTVDEEFNDFAVEQLCATDQLIFGRVTYDLMAGYWPHHTPAPASSKNDAMVAQLMNGIPKIVVSRTMKTAEWDGTRVINADVAGELLKLKQEPGEEIAVFGSSNLAVTLMEHGLIDEFRIMVSPTIIGEGEPLFHGALQKMDLRLIRTRTFRNGNVLHYYRNR